LFKLTSSWPPARVEGGFEQQFLTPFPVVAGGSRGKPGVAAGSRGRILGCSFLYTGMVLETHLLGKWFPLGATKSKSYPKATKRDPMAIQRHPNGSQRSPSKLQRTANERPGPPQRPPKEGFGLQMRGPGIQMDRRGTPARPKGLLLLDKPLRLDLQGVAWLSSGAFRSGCVVDSGFGY